MLSQGRHHHLSYPVKVSVCSAEEIRQTAAVAVERGRGGGGRGLEWKMVRAGARGLGQGAPLGVPRGVAQRVRQRAVQVRAVAVMTIMAVMAIMATMTIAQVAIGQTPVKARVAARLLSRRLVQLGHLILAV